MANKIPREWLDGEVTITREEFGKIMINEQRAVLFAAKMTGLDEDIYDFLKDLLSEFCANLGVEVFKKLEEEEEER